MKKPFVSTFASSLMLAAVFSSAQESASWTDHIELKGDIRGRYESVEVDGETSKSRMRGRARVGIYADVNDQVRGGVRIATGSDESPTSTNQSIEDFGNKRDIWMDLVYMGYSPDAVENLDVVFGKMKKPWEAVSDLMFDGDLNPEGLNFNYTSGGDIEFTANLGYFLWQDSVNGDPETDVTMPAGQLAAKVAMSETVSLSLGANAFLYDNIEDADIPTSDSDKGTATVTDVNGNEQTVQVVKSKSLSKGNSADEDGTWTYGYELIEGFAKLDFKNDVMPVKLYVDYIVNVASGVEDDTAILFGVGLKHKKLSFDYNYRDIERDAIVGVLADGDFAGGGAGGSGHKFKAKYTLLKNWTAGLTYFVAEDYKERDVDTLQADLVVKF